MGCKHDCSLDLTAHVNIIVTCNDCFMCSNNILLFCLFQIGVFFKPTCWFHYGLGVITSSLCVDHCLSVTCVCAGGDLLVTLTSTFDAKLRSLLSSAANEAAEQPPCVTSHTLFSDPSLHKKTDKEVRALNSLFPRQYRLLISTSKVKL